jgi:phosphopantothenoylcysteine synthetase/decarboxylase
MADRGQPASSSAGPRGVLYALVCGAPRARDIGELVTRAQAGGWTVCVVATPQALPFFDVTGIEELTGYPVRSSYKHPGEPDVLPSADAMIACPVTFNTLNKWALGISDTLVLGLLTEAAGLNLPLVAGPSLNNAQEQHPAFRRSVTALREMGVHVLYGPGIYETAAPGTGSRSYDWDLPLRALDDLLSRRDRSPQDQPETAGGR